jgi:hypothetical protein
MSTSDTTRPHRPEVPRFTKWYFLSLLVWIAGETLIWALVVAFLKLSLGAILVPALLWLLPPVISLPLIFRSWKYSKQPRSRILVFVTATFIFFLLCLVALSLTSYSLFRSKWSTLILPGGIVGILIATATAYFVSTRRLSDR